jgi:hypothetical protein
MGEHGVVLVGGVLSVPWLLDPGMIATSPSCTELNDAPRRLEGRLVLGRVARALRWEDKL